MTLMMRFDETWDDKMRDDEGGDRMRLWLEIKEEVSEMKN